MSQMLSLKLYKSNQNYLHAKLDFLFLYIKVKPYVDAE